MNYITIQTLAGNTVVFSADNKTLQSFKAWYLGDLLSQRSPGYALPGQNGRAYTDPSFLFENGAIAKKDIDTVKWDKPSGMSFSPRAAGQPFSMQDQLVSQLNEGQVTH